MARNEFLVVGFKDEAPLARRVAAALKTKAKFVAAEKYRAGELNLLGPSAVPRRVVVAANVREPAESLFRVLSLAHGLRQVGAKRVVLLAPWIAYGRQDRATHPGEEPLGLLVGNLLGSMFDRIVTLDAHSPAFMAAFKGRLANVMPWASFKMPGIDLVVAPDRGATERASLAADALGVPFMVIEKKRLVGARHAAPVQSKLPGGAKVKGARVLLVDDMSDSGGTLKAAARVLKEAGAASVVAVVSQAFDLCRLNSSLAPEIAAVECLSDHASGILADDALRELVRATA